MTGNFKSAKLRPLGYKKLDPALGAGPREILLDGARRERSGGELDRSVRFKEAFKRQ